MIVHEFKGIVGEVIAAINAGSADGLNTVSGIELTREEMDAFIKSSPFNKNIGKNYGDQDVPPLMHVTSNPSGGVTGFYLAGVYVFCNED